MKGLTSLDLSHNRLEDLPTTLNELVKLRSLELAHNRIDALPAELAQLTALERLGINDNAIAARPHVFDEMFYPARDAEGRAKANVLKALSLNNNALARPFDAGKPLTPHEQILTNAARGLEMLERDECGLHGACVG